MTFTETRQAGDNRVTVIWPSKEAKAAVEEQIGHPIAGTVVPDDAPAKSDEIWIDPRTWSPVAD